MKATVVLERMTCTTKQYVMIHGMFDKINEYYRSYYCIVVYLYVSNTVFEVLDVFVVLFDMFDVVFVVLFGVFDAVFAYRCNHS